MFPLNRGGNHFKASMGCVLSAMCAACGFSEGSLTLDASVLGDGSADASDPFQMLCDPIDASTTPALRADFSTIDLSHLIPLPPLPKSIEETASSLTTETDRRVGPCRGAWKFLQEPQRSGHIKVDGFVSDAATLRAVVELPTVWSNMPQYIDQAVLTKSGAVQDGRFELTLHRERGQTSPRIVAQIRSDSVSLLCSPPLTDAVVDIRLHMGEGEAAKLIFRAWDESEARWGAFQEAHETEVELTFLGAPRTCGLATSASVIGQSDNRNAITIGYSNSNSNAGFYNFTGWIAQLEYYGARLTEPLVENSP